MSLFNFPILFFSKSDLKSIFDEIERNNSLIYEVINQGATIMATMDDVLDTIKEIAGAVNALEAKVTAALANQGIPADVQAKIDQAFADAKAVVTDATDGVDEGAVV